MEWQPCERYSMCMYTLGLNTFNDYNGDLCLYLRSKRSNSANIWDLLRIMDMLKVFNCLGIGAEF